MSSKQSQNADEILKSFLSHDPRARYTFDSEKDSLESQVCRKGPQSEECITVKMSSKQLFKAMQDHGFFCALPSNPGKTHMECRPFP